MSLQTLLAIEGVRKFLQDVDVYRALGDLAQKNDIDEDRVDEFLDLTDAVLDEQFPLSDVPAVLQEAFGIDTLKATALAADIVGIRLLPLEIFVPGISEQLRTWGKDPAHYPHVPIAREHLSADEFAQRVANAANVSFSPLLMHRLAFLLTQYNEGKKTEEALRTFFGRSLTIGGMGLSKEEGDALCDAVVHAAFSVKIGATDVQQGIQETEHDHKHEISIAPSHEVAMSVPIISSPLRHNEDDHPDPPSIKKAGKAKRARNAAVQVAFADAIDLALAQAQETLREASISSATFSDIVGKTLRGVRDAYQTRSLLEREYRVRGSLLARLLEALLAAQEAYRVALDALAQVEEVDEHISDDEEATIAQQEAHTFDERFAEITKKPLRPQMVKVELSTGSVVPSETLNMQKRASDVLPGQRLMSPVEQLEMLTIADFRRMSTNPEEAVRKLHALLDALEKDTYEKRMEGVHAWRKSPLNQLIIALMTESLTGGITVAEVVTRRRAEGKESMSPAEMHALGKWNDSLRF